MTEAITPVTCKCGGTVFYRSRRTGGWWVDVIDGSGDVIDTNLDSVRYGSEPKTVKCADCGRANRNPKHKDDSRGDA